MTISFNSIPTTIRTVGQHVEFDGSRATQSLNLQPQRILVIGQKLAAGPAPTTAAIRITSVDQAKQQFGQGSMLAQMIKALRAANETTETWVFPLADLVAGATATGTVTVTGTATASGTIVLYIGGQRVTVGVTSGDTATAVAAAIVAAITAAADLPVSAAAAAGVVTLTAKHKGLCGNDIDVRLNFYQGERLPAGVTIAIVSMSGGTGNPDVAAVFTAIGDAQYTTIVLPYTDAANLVVVETELASRWGPMRQIEGMVYSAARGTQGALATLGGALNSPHVSIIGAKNSPTTPWEWAASYAGVVAFYGAIDPARPFQTLSLPGVLAPAEADRFTRTERELLLVDGISTFVVDMGGNVLLERPISTYQTNAYGFDDTAYLDVNTLLTLAALRYSQRARIAQKYPRHKLANDGTKAGAGQAIVTPSVIRAELVALAREWEDAGWVENIDGFIAGLIVERSATDPNRINALVTPDLVNQLRVFAAQIQFRL